MKIGELSRRTGVSARALRYYEEEGLVRPERSGNGYREFGEGAVEMVQQIRGLIENGLPTRLIREILPYLEGPTDLVPQQTCAYMLDQLTAQREQLDRRITCLTSSRDALDEYLRTARRTVPAQGVR